MSRINTNVPSLLARTSLARNTHSQTTTLERLSTGLAINRGADNPAGLIASESLRSEKASIGAAIDNATRADQVINIAEGGLQEVNSLLLELQSLVGQSANTAGLSTEEKNANQLQVDSILQTIDRISSSTSFQGTKLLNGTFDFTITNQSTSVNSFQINAAKFGTTTSRAVQVVVTGSAQHAGLFLSAGGTGLDLTSSSSRFTFELAGVKGSREFTFASGTSLADIETAVNTFTAVTGLSAHTSGNGIVVKSTEYGSDQFVSFNVSSAGGQGGGVYQLNATNEAASQTSGGTAFSSITNPIRDIGQDVGATINGITATSKGRKVSVNTDYLDLSIELKAVGATALGTINALTINGGGAKFNLGPKVDITNEVSVGIKNVATRYLGDSSNGFLSSLASGQSNNVVDGNLTNAQAIVSSSISQVSSVRGRLGAFQKNVIGATINSLNVALENTSSAESAIRDTDFAATTAELTRSQILVSAATNVLSLANSAPQSVLRLLQG